MIKIPPAATTNLSCLGLPLRALATGCLWGILATNAIADAPAPTRTPTSHVMVSAVRGDTDSIARLKTLTSGVGCDDWQPNQDTLDGLRQIGIRTLRGIHVGVLVGEFAPDGAFHITKAPDLLDQNLAICKEVGANLHIVFGAVPDQLKISYDPNQNQSGIMGQHVRHRLYWNGDWPKLEAYWKALFHYVLIEKGFSKAEFELGNEPDIDGQFPRLPGKDGNNVMGSRGLYEGYLEVYRHASQAAQDFEKENPGTTVFLGGPALAWAFSFHYGEFNWMPQFLNDCAAEHLKLDFIGFHYYGNISSLHGEYPAPALTPSFREMLEDTKQWRDEFEPNVPFFITEWGPSYRTNDDPNGLVNASDIGAAWSAEFLNTMLNEGITEALFLTTTDLPQEKEVEPFGRENWGWPSLFTNPKATGTWPKPIYHVFEMIHMLQDERIPIDHLPQPIHAIATRSGDGKHVAVLLWNYNANIPQTGAAVDSSVDTPMVLTLTRPKDYFGTATTLKVTRWEVSKNYSNAYQEFMDDHQITDKCRLQQVGSPSTVSVDDPKVSFTLPPSGVSLVTWDVGN